MQTQACYWGWWQTQRQTQKTNLSISSLMKNSKQLRKTRGMLLRMKTHTMQMRMNARFTWIIQNMISTKTIQKDKWIILECCLDLLLCGILRTNVREPGKNCSLENICICLYLYLFLFVDCVVMTWSPEISWGWVQWGRWQGWHRFPLTESSWCRTWTKTSTDFSEECFFVQLFTWYNPGPFVTLSRRKRFLPQAP